MKIGDTYEVNSGGFCEVIGYLNNKNVTIKFLDGYQITKKVAKSQILLGDVLNPYAKTIYGVGYIGVGDFKTVLNGKHTSEYNTWSHMFSRCHSSHESCSYESYLDKHISVSWHCFQNFAEWCQTATGFGNKGWHLDKDLLIKGNKEYSLDTCIFLPPEINGFLVKREKCRGDLPLGVSQGTSAYVARCSNKVGVPAYIGSFKDSTKAFLAFKSQKELIAKMLANKYVEQISNEAYFALYNYTVDIED